MPEGRPQASWLRHVKSYLKDMGMAGLASVWTMARQRTKEYRRKVDAATRCSGCPDRPPPDATMKRVDAPSAWPSPSDLDKKESDGRDPPQEVAPHAHRGVVDAPDFCHRDPNAIESSGKLISRRSGDKRRFRVLE